MVAVRDTVPRRAKDISEPLIKDSISNSHESSPLKSHFVKRGATLHLICMEAWAACCEPGRSNNIVQLANRKR